MKPADETPCACGGSGVAWRYGRHRDGNSVREPYPCRCQSGSWAIPGTTWVDAEPGRCGGRPCIRGTRFNVDAVIRYFDVGYTPGEMAEEWDHIPRAAFEEIARLRREKRFPDSFWDEPFVPNRALERATAERGRGMSVQVIAPTVRALNPTTVVACARCKFPIRFFADRMRQGEDGVWRIYCRPCRHQPPVCDVPDQPKKARPIPPEYPGALGNWCRNRGWTAAIFHHQEDTKHYCRVVVNTHTRTCEAWGSGNSRRQARLAAGVAVWPLVRECENEQQCFENRA